MKPTSVIMSHYKNPKVSSDAMSVPPELYFLYQTSFSNICGTNEVCVVGEISAKVCDERKVDSVQDKTEE